MAQDQQQVTDALYLGNLDPKVNKRILYDICIQVGNTQQDASRNYQPWHYTA